MESDSQSPKMQQVLVLHLSNYQVKISEIEQNIHYLLENCEDIEDDQEQIDALSSKLEEVKLDLDDLQMMLEDTSLEEEGLDDERETSESETHLEDSGEIQTDPWIKNAISDWPSTAQSLCHLSPPIEDDERSGSESPDSVESIQLRWDLAGDVGGSSSSKDKEEGNNYSALSGTTVGWELIQAQDLRNKFRIMQKLQQWQQLNSDLSEVSAWLLKTEQELKELQKAKPPTSMEALGQKVKKLKDMLKAFDNYKTVMLSINLSTKEFQKGDRREFKGLQNKLRKVNLLWEEETHALDNWRNGLKEAVLRCREFHDLIQKLILWLARADNRRDKAQITDPNADLDTILECQRALMQLEKDLLFHQPKVYSLEELAAYLLIKSNGEYIEADELINLIGKKMRQLIEQVSHDLKAIQGNLTHIKRTAVGRNSSSTRDERHLQPIQAVSCPPSFFNRVLRAALPFLVVTLLLLLLACTVLSYGTLQLHQGQQRRPFFPFQAAVPQWASNCLGRSLFINI